MLRIKWMKIIAQILLSLSLLLLGYEIYDYYAIKYHLEQTGRSTGANSADEISARIDTILQQVMQKGQYLAHLLHDTKHWQKDTLHALLAKESRSFSNILGITAAFEPKLYPNKTLYAPYYDKNKDGFIFIEDVYDYTDASLTTSQWYVRVRDKGAQWIEPYYAEGAQAMVADYGVPFYWKNPQTGQEEVAGTITMTISLAAFSRLMNTLSLGKTGYGFVISRKGKYLSHPIREYINNKNILKLAEEVQDPIFRKAAQQMTEGRSGEEEYQSRLTNQHSYLFYRPVPSAGWSLGIVLIKDEFLGSSAGMEQKSLAVFMSASWVMVLVFFLVFKVYYFQIASLWAFSTSFSVIILVNILFCWYLKLNKYTHQSQAEEVTITSNSSLEQFLTHRQNYAEEMKLVPPIPIPTGVFVREIEMEDSYNVNISGLVWQKYPHDLSDSIKKGITFPQVAPHAESEYISHHHRELTRDYELHRWEFRLTLRLNFDYTTYPFDRRKMAIILMPREMHGNLILTPDLGGYKLLSPSAKPGINSGVVLPGFQIERSAFSYLYKDYNTNFGMEQAFHPELSPELHYNILIHRNFINAFVINFIPIFVVALMLYLIIYSSSKKVSSVGVVESSAAFFFVLVLAHIDLRSSIQSDRITYMEFFYFIMYLVLVMSVFNIILFTRRDNVLFFDYRDNLIVKLLYWPTFLGLSFLATLFTFF